MRTSLGTKPIPASSGLFAYLRRHSIQDVFARVGGQQSGDSNLSEAPGVSELISCAGALAGARTPLNEPRPLLLGNEECPH